MSSGTNTKGPPKKPVEKQEKTKPPSLGGSTDRFKTVVRRLPPNLPEEVFWQSVQQWVTEETTSWKLFYPGKFRKRLNKENIPSRAYIAFKDEEQLAAFSREYDGHLFRDKAGNESIAVVEFAPYQKVPVDKKKPDARNATIEKDDDYISFLESLKASQASVEPISLESLIAANQPLPQPKTTPLLEALKAEMAARKEKESAAKNILLQKGAASATGPSNTKKEDNRKAALPPAQQQKPAVEPPQVGRKAARKAAAIQKAISVQMQGSKAPSKPPAQALASAPTQGQAPKHPRSPKLPRPSREEQARQVVANNSQSNAAASTSTMPMPSTAIPSSSGKPEVVEGSGAAPSAEAPRRARPVLGLGSRHLQAALSGAGVAVGSAERKPRGQDIKEREGQWKADDAGAGPSIGAADNATSAGEKLVPKPRERNNRRKDTAGGQSSANAAAGGAGQSQLRGSPNILKRAEVPAPTILQREEPQGATAESGVTGSGGASGADSEVKEVGPGLVPPGQGQGGGQGQDTRHHGGHRGHFRRGRGRGRGGHRAAPG